MCITGDHVCRPRVDGNNIYFFSPFSVLLYVFFGVSVLTDFLSILYESYAVFLKKITISPIFTGFCTYCRIYRIYLHIVYSWLFLFGEFPRIFPFDFHQFLMKYAEKYRK